MHLDKEKILLRAEELRKSRIDNDEVLFELLGGALLSDIFNSSTITSIIHSFINDGKLHNCIEGDGMDVLEGLLNRQIIGDIEKFYNIEPKYIFSLDEMQQRKIAKGFAGNAKAQEELLVSSWQNGLKTVACGGEDVQPYMLFEIDLDDPMAISKMSKITEALGKVKNINYTDKTVTVNFYGDIGKNDEFYNLLRVCVNTEVVPDEFTAKVLSALRDYEVMLGEKSTYLENILKKVQMQTSEWLAEIWKIFDNTFEENSALNAGNVDGVRETRSIREIKEEVSLIIDEKALENRAVSNKGDVVLDSEEATTQDKGQNGEIRFSIVPEDIEGIENMRLIFERFSVLPAIEVSDDKLQFIFEGINVAREEVVEVIDGKAQLGERTGIFVEKLLDGFVKELSLVKEEREYFIKIIKEQKEEFMDIFKEDWDRFVETYNKNVKLRKELEKRSKRGAIQK